MHFGFRVTQRREETKSLDMVHMQVSEQHIHASNVAWDGGSEPSNACARIEHKQGAVAATYLDAGSIASIARCIRPRRSHRAASTPQRDFHLLFYLPEEHYRS